MFIKNYNLQLDIKVIKETHVLDVSNLYPRSFFNFNAVFVPLKQWLWLTRNTAFKANVVSFNYVYVFEQFDEIR